MAAIISYTGVELLRRRVGRRREGRGCDSVLAALAGNAAIAIYIYTWTFRWINVNVDTILYRVAVQVSCDFEKRAKSRLFRGTLQRGFERLFF